MTLSTSCSAVSLARQVSPRKRRSGTCRSLKKVTETPEWHAFTDKGGLKKAFLSGPDLRTWLETAEALHRDLMAKAGC